MTGYDLCKLMAGSYGTLAALEEVTVKVLPRPETVATVLFCRHRAECGVAADGGGARLGARGLGRRLPACRHGGAASAGRVALRVEGPAPSVAARRDSLIAEHRGTARPRSLASAESIALWRAIGEVAPLPIPASARYGASRSRRRPAPRWPRRWRVTSTRRGCSIGAAGWCGSRCRRPAMPAAAIRRAIRGQTAAAPVTRRWSKPRPACAGRAGVRAAAGAARRIVARASGGVRPGAHPQPRPHAADRAREAEADADRIHRWPSSPTRTPRHPKRSCAPACIAASAPRPARPTCCSATSSTARAAAST